MAKISFQIQYSDSLRDARKEIDDGARRKAEIDVKVARLRDDLAEIRSRFISFPSSATVYHNLMYIKK